MLAKRRAFQQLWLSETKKPGGVYTTLRTEHLIIELFQQELLTQSIGEVASANGRYRRRAAIWMSLLSRR